MDNYLTSIKKLIIVSLLLIVFWTYPIHAFSVWQVEKYEQVLSGQYIELKDNKICLQNKTIDEYVLDENILVAIMGNQTGRLISLAFLPLNIQVELILSKNNKVRAIRNQILEDIPVKGTPLLLWGHELSFSPDEKNLMLFHFEKGLYLHSLNDNGYSKYLSQLPIAAWNKDGTKISYLSSEKIVIEDLISGQKRNVALTNKDYPFTITSLIFSHESDYLLSSSLPDSPDIDSDLFLLSIIDEQGQKIREHLVPNLGQTFFLDNHTILYTTYQDQELSEGKILMWNFYTNEVTSLFPSSFKNLHDLTWNTQTKTLAFSLAREVSENLYLFDFNKKELKQLLTFPFPLRHLQWSNENTLFFWDEINNVIYEVVDDRFIPRTSGYLPQQGIHKQLFFFTAEPIEEPLQPLLYLEDL